jgi:hypothetical protein
MIAPKRFDSSSIRLRANTALLGPTYVVRRGSAVPAVARREVTTILLASAKSAQVR